MQSLNSELVVGCKIFVKIKKDKVEDEQEHRKAEILSIRTNNAGQTEYYIHFMEFNKRFGIFNGPV